LKHRSASTTESLAVTGHVLWRAMWIQSTVEEPALSEAKERLER
jgi:hypothetical protein